MTESHDNATCRRATTTDPAVQAVAEAMHADLCPDDECDGSDMGEWDRQAEVAVAAARPVIAAEVLDQVRAALRAEATIRAYEKRDLANLDLWNLAGQFTPEWLEDVLRDRADDLEGAD